jgi:hypothetical protein
MERDPGADAAPVSDDAMCAHTRSRTHVCARAHYGIGSNQNVVTQPDAGTEYGRGVDAGLPDRLGVETLQQRCQGAVNISNDNAGERCAPPHRQRLCYENRSCLRALKIGQVFRVSKKTELRRAGAVQRRYIYQVRIGRAL